MQETIESGFSANHLSLRRGRRRVLEQISLQLQPGRVLSLLGANGAGKSTFLSAFAGEIRPEPGGRRGAPITLNGRPLSELSAVQQARRRGVLPQNPGLAFDLRVAEVVSMGAYPFPSLSRDEVDALIRAALGRADILALAQRPYLELSGGEQQRVHFARAVAQVLAERQADPQGRYLLLDEPTASLDPLHQQALLRTVAELARAERMGVLIILHDVNLAALWSDRIALLSQGRLLACGEPAAVLTPENLKTVYGVDVRIMPHPGQPDKPLVVFG